MMSALKALHGKFRGGPGPALTAVAVITVIAGLLAADTSAQRWLRLQLFDTYQHWQPRERKSAPAVVIEIDEESLAAYGQWPWPRHRLAALMDGIAALHPAAIGVDIILPEPDRLSPQRLLEAVPGLGADVRARIARMRSNDARLADSIRGRRVVLGMAGENGGPVKPPRRPLVVPALRWHGGAAEGSALQLDTFSGVIRSIPEIEKAAAGVGLLNNPDPSSPVVRRPLLMGRLADVPVPSLAVELLRVATSTRWIDVDLSNGALRQLRLGDVHIPVEADGRSWLRYGRFDPNRYVSARAVMEGRVPPEEVEQKIALLAVTGLGLLDLQTTPLSEKVFGIEVHLQLIETIFDGSWLVRPSWALAIETLLFVVLALALTTAVLSKNQWSAPLLFAGLSSIVLLGGIALFDAGILLDAASPLAGAALAYASLLVISLAEARRQRREMEARLQVQREQAARLNGELDAARRVQMGMLPESPDVRSGDMRLEIKAFMEPAKSVGGDFYDFFMLDDNTLFAMVGDVSGKGLPAAIFMALVKSLCKSAALRRGSLAEAIADAESEIVRENPELMFVTLSVLTLDLHSGDVEYCNAGHDPPYSLLDGRVGHVRLADGGGPPLCVLPGFAYEAGRYRMAPQEMLCLVTDGVTDACNPQGVMYGRARLEAALEGISSEGPATVVGTLRQVLSMFSAGEELADDQTAVVLRWNGPGTSGLIRPGD